MDTTFTTTGNSEVPVSLNQLIRTLVEKTAPLAVQHSTRIMNEVDRELLLGEGALTLSKILEELIEAVILNSKEGDIHISADRFKDMVLLHIEERNNYNGYALSFSVGSLVPDAARIGGHISMEGERKRAAHIQFSFPGQYAA